MIHIYDALAYLRRSLNRANLGQSVEMSPRLAYNAANASPLPQIWVWDGAQNNDRRRALLPGYKVRDYSNQEDIFTGLRLYKQLLGLSTAVQITVPDYEADDVCATLAKHWTSQGVPVTIHTNDFDYHQLANIPLLTLRGFSAKENVPPKFVTLYKALVGDKSDKIDGIPNFGHKRWEAMSGIWPVLKQALIEDDRHTFRNQPWTPAVRAWLNDDANFDLVQIYFKITHMMDVPLDHIEKHTVPGVRDDLAANKIFSEFML